MISGVSVESVSRTATWTSLTGTWNADYPVSNLGDLKRPSKVARVAPASGGASLNVHFDDAYVMRMVSLVHHTLDVGASMRIRLYGDPLQTQLRADSGVLPVWPDGLEPEAGLLAVRPYLFPTTSVAKSARIDFSDMAAAADIGAIEIARFWDWRGISPGAELGIDVRTPATALAGGATRADAQWSPRTYNGELTYLEMKEAATRGIDFQKIKGQAYPFVFVEDYEEPATWATGCFLARNAELPPMVGAMYRHDTFQFRLTEHAR